jgi:hypothetical protein
VGIGRWVWLIEAEPGPAEGRARRNWSQLDQAWHAAEAEEAERAGRWSAAAFHLSLLAEARPDDAELRRRLEKARAERLTPH